MKAIIDGDMILYRVAFAAETEIRWDDDVWTLSSDFRTAKLETDNLVARILDELNVDDYLMVFSHKKNFRHKIYPNYKSNRKDKRKPLGISDIRDWMMETYRGITYYELEADDVIGILCTRNSDYIAVSGDKDFNTIPCTWYNHLKKELVTITEEQADYYHLMQSLTGDAVDGYEGIKGVGPKTAMKILDKDGPTWETVVSTYESKGYTIKDAVTNARLARILRDENYNMETQTINHWSPDAIA